MKNLREYTQLKNTLGESLKSPLQVNKLFEADCEILKLAENKYLTTSIDSVGEEIDLGLYKQIETWAWMCVMSSVSDLAASGSTPLGITLAAQWKYGTELEVQNLFYKSINMVCTKAEVALLGGDTGGGISHAFTTSILGESSRPPLMRTNIEEGDVLVLSHRQTTGIGPTLAFRFIMNADESIMPENLFRPMPSWKEAAAIAPFARAAIDTSDGIATSAYILTELNDLGVDLVWDESINSPKAMEAMTALNLSPLFLWLGDHGDFHTLYVIPEKNMDKIKLSKDMSVIGKFKKRSEADNNFRIHYNNQWINLPIENITQCTRDIDSYTKLIKETQKYLETFV